MIPRFENLPFRVSTIDGRNVEVLCDVFFLSSDGSRYCIPAGATSDGASTPPEVWPVIPPFGPYWPAAVLHDAAYRGTLMISTGDTTWAPANLGRVACDNLLLEAMGSLGVDVIVRQTIYQAVKLTGGQAFVADRKIDIEPETQTHLEAIGGSGGNDGSEHDNP